MITADDVRANSALLKLDLYCKGARLDESCLGPDGTGRGLMRTRAGLGSGLEAVLPGGLWTNIPVLEPFAERSPYLIRRDAGGLLLERDGRPVSALALAPRPAWYGASTRTGKPMTRVGTLQGTYLGVMTTHARAGLRAPQAAGRDERPDDSGAPSPAGAGVEGVGGSAGGESGPAGAGEASADVLDRGSVFAVTREPGQGDEHPVFYPGRSSPSSIRSSSPRWSRIRFAIALPACRAWPRSSRSAVR